MCDPLRVHDAPILAFAIACDSPRKEAVYKALDPFVRRYVGFGEVAVSPCENGTARVAQGLRAQEGPFAIDVRWRRFDGIVLTTARVTAGGT